jgi:3D (Asp-Asp-Asp) domain-containing protein
VREPKPGILAVGVNGDASLAQLARRGFTSTVKVTGSAMRMVATAYSPTCNGCSGRTKSGQWAGLGIVAVDPRVIPLGTRLYIPGYGQAVAGDVGGAIRGNRIDLGFRSTTDATEFGTRPILVYLIGK